MRYTGASLSYSLGGIFGGAMAPMIGAEIAAKFGSHAIGYYIAGMALLSILSVVYLRNNMPANFEVETPERIDASNQPKLRIEGVA
jgi:fucose permease